MPPATEPLLRTEGVTVRFGGLLALENASIDVQPGTLTALIGPNGAGKSTLVQVVSGFQRPTSGDVLLRGESIVGRKPHELVKLGLARTFQDVEIFGRLTVAENVAMALPDQRSDSMTQVADQAVADPPGARRSHQHGHRHPRDNLA